MEKDMLRLRVTSLKKKNHRIISGESLTTAVTQKAQRKITSSYVIGAFTKKEISSKIHIEM